MNFMSDRTFVDTNVLIYAHDVDADAKRQIAKAVLEQLWSERAGVLSMQVLQEFYVNLTRKIPSPLPMDITRLVVRSYSIWCMETTPAEISAAFRIEDESQIGFRGSCDVFTPPKKRRDPHSLGRSERWTTDRRHSC